MIDFTIFTSHVSARDEWMLLKPARAGAELAEHEADPQY